VLTLWVRDCLGNSDELLPVKLADFTNFFEYLFSEKPAETQDEEEGRKIGKSVKKSFLNWLSNCPTIKYLKNSAKPLKTYSPKLKRNTEISQAKTSIQDMFIIFCWRNNGSQICLLCGSPCLRFSPSPCRSVPVSPILPVFFATLLTTSVFPNKIGLKSFT